MADTDTSNDGDAADDEADGAEPKKKGKLLLILALVGVLLVSGGGAATWFLVLAPGDEGAAVVAEVEPEPAPPEVPAFVAVEWLVVQTRGRRTPFRSLSVLVTLEVDGEGFADAEVAGAMPRLRDAFLLALSEPPLVSDPNERVDATEVKARIGAAADAILGDHLVRDVLIVSILDAPA